MKKLFEGLKIYQIVIIISALAVNIFIIVNSCLPAGESSKESGWLVNLLVNVINTFKADAINEGNIGTFSSVIRKLIGHFGLFMVSGILTTLTIKFLYLDKGYKFSLFIVFSISSGLFLSILTEAIQRFVPGRSGEVRDMIIDFSGYLIASLVTILISLHIEKKKNKKGDI